MFFAVSGVLIGLVIVLWYRWRRNLFTVFKDLGIPGPEPSIFFGNVKEMAEKNPLTCQNEWIEKYGDVLGYYYGTTPTLLITNPDILKQVLIKDFTSFADRPKDFYAADGDRPDQTISHSLVNTTGKKWKEVRSLVTPAFTTGKLKKMMILMKDTVELMVTKLSAASENGSKDVNAYELYRGMTMDAIGKVAFGVDHSIQDNPKHPLMVMARLLLSADFSSWLNFIFVSFRELHFALGPLRDLLLKIYNKGSSPVDEIASEMAQVVKLRRDNPSHRRQDLLQMLLDARGSKDDISESSLVASAEALPAENELPETGLPRLSKNLLQLSSIDVEANSMLFFLAGFETTSTTMAFVTHYLVNNISVQDKVRQEILDVFGDDDCNDYDKLMKLQYTDRVISESLRMNPPIFSFIMRVAAREIELGKWKIPAGMVIQIPVHNLHHNPEHFENPSEFNPDRFLPENRGKNHSVTWLPFGAGPRNCVGMRLALVEIKMALVTMLQRFKLEPCGKTEIGEIELYFNFAVASPKNGVFVRAVPI